MAKVAMTQKLAAAADEVWNRIGGFSTIHEWHPAIEHLEAEGTGVGSTRNLTIAGGISVVERLVAEDGADRTYTYEMLEAPLPVKDYVATIRVNDDGGGASIVEWTSTFEPAGVPEPEAAAIIEGIYTSGFAAMCDLSGAG